MRTESRCNNVLQTTILALTCCCSFITLPVLVEGFSTMMSAASISKTATMKRIVLIGGGHAHIQVIKALNKQSRPKYLDVTLIDMCESASYSGMVPGCIANHYRPEQTLLQLEPLAKWAGIQFINDKVVDIDLKKKEIKVLKQNKKIIYDVVSIDIGSTSRGVDTISGVKEYAIPTRPISELITKIQDKEKELQRQNTNENIDVVVVGGGGAGIELSFSIKERWKDIFKNRLTVTLLDAGNGLLPNECSNVRNVLRNVLNDRCIDTIHNANVQSISSTHVCLDNNHKVPYTVCIWATGASAHSLPFTLGNNQELDVTKNGWIRVNKYLQSLSHPNIFAAGDCCSYALEKEGSSSSTIIPKAGVYAVRSGPILIDNLTKFLSGGNLTPYKPQDDFLKLLVCGEDKALGFRFGIPIYGKWVFKLKDAIDQGFMDLFRKENLQSLPDIDHSDDNDDNKNNSNGGSKSSYDRSQYDAKFVSNTNKEKLNPKDAAVLLQRIDDDVNYEEPWKILRDMAQDDSYRAAIKKNIAHQE